MSRSAAYCVLIRDGKQRWFADVWSSLRRELVWGPEAFEAWLTAGEEIDWEPEDVSGAAIVDFDTKTLLWGEQDVLLPPRAHSLHSKLLEHSWSGFSIIDLPSSQLDTELYELLDESPMDQDEGESASWEDRPSTVQDAAEYFCTSDDEDVEADDDDEMEEPFSEDNPGAWLTLIDKHGKLRQRGLSAISVDLLSGDQSALEKLASLEPVELPEEKFVTEGLWIDLGEQKMGYWGVASDAIVRRLKSGWPTWSVEVAERGYSQQCEISGLPAKSMSDAEALGQFLPGILSNKRMTMANLFDAMGGSLKKTAIKATGCLTILLSLPILLVAFFMDKWKEAGYALLTLLVIVVALFKIVEYKLKSRFSQSGLVARDESLEEQRPPVAGPLDESLRKQRVDEMLAGCGLPSLAEIEPHFDKSQSIL